MVTVQFLAHNTMISTVSVSSPEIMAPNHLDNRTVKLESPNDLRTKIYYSHPTIGSAGEKELLLPPNNIKNSSLLGGTKSKSDACLSPEKNVSWILNGECLQDPHISSSDSMGHHRTCGFCGEGAAYLRQLRDEISAKFEDRCNDMVVYGVAFGLKVEGWMREAKYLGSHNNKAVERHGTCLFQFVTNHTGFKEKFSLSVDGSQILIVVDEAKLPYNNNRRNVKLIKLNPGLLFPWADRVIWQDAKLLRSPLGNRPSPKGLPSNYHRHFNRTVQRFGTCASFMGLPHHESAVRNSTSVDLKVHCETIVAAAVKRPTVTDSLEVLLAHCENNIKKYNNPTDLTDTAFIVWDMRSSACQKFNGDLGCSWQDIIHCNSDRDQISFPSTLASLGVHLSHKREIPLQELHDRVYVNENNVPMVHLAKRSCHWYYRSLSRCVAPPGEVFTERTIDSNNIPTTVKECCQGLRVAVIVAGTVNRFMFNSTIHNLISPLVKRKVDVDYYVSLATSSGKAYRSNNGYMSHVQPDPCLPSNLLSDPIIIEDFIQKEIGIAGASIGEVTIQDSIDIDSEAMLAARRERSLKDHPDEDPDLRFPIFDVRNEEIRQRTANANRNLLRIHLAIQNLWRSALKWEEEEGFKYDFVMFLRDDFLWLSKFSISDFASSPSDIFIPACDARDPP